VTPPKSEPPPLDPELTEHLRAEPVLCQQLLSAFHAGRWLMTVHWKGKDSPPDDLRHAETHRQFPVADMPGALDHIKGQLAAAEGRAPAAEDWT